MLNLMKKMHLRGLACVRVKGVESEWFRIDSDVRHWSIMSPWLFNVLCMDAVVKEVKMGM